MMKCEICGDEVKNLGVHKYHKHRDKIAPGTVIEVDKPKEIIIDVPKEKPLSELVDEMKKLLRPYRFTIKVSYEEEDVDKKYLEITARIHYRR
jgi:ribosomal protein L6P/L9E